MVYQPPAGARDLFPLDVAQKIWIEARLQHVFHRWGYHRIITSTLERIETLMAGGAIDRSTVIQMQGDDDELLGLRPELTASIARAAATRLTDLSYPHRLYYNANVFRRPIRGSHHRRQEFFQAGVELLGSAGTTADAEILLILSDCLQSLNLSDYHLVLGDAGLTRSLLSSFPQTVQAPIRRAIAHLDRMAIEALELSDQLRAQVLTLFDLRGKPEEVLQRVTELNLNPEQHATVHQLKTLIDLFYDSVAQQGQATPPSIVLDLSLIQTFDYYTGIVFEVVAPSLTGYRVLGQGGRYDQLLGLYHPQHRSYPGVGFSLNLEDLQQVLIPTGQLPMETPVSAWLVVATTAIAQSAAFAYAQKIRDSKNPVQVELYLEVCESPDTVRRYALRRGIPQIAWIQADGSPTIETLTSA
jgi:ATP phosphoribosyltransferase regulatory subunit